MTHGNAIERDFMQNEGQEGMSTISTRLYMDEDKIMSHKPQYLFAEMFSEDLVAYQINDAGIAHMPKLVKSYATTPNYRFKITEDFSRAGKNHSGDNEVAFYRKIRNHEKRNKEKTDGRIKPSFICIVDDKGTDGSISDIPIEKFEYAKKYNIPIIVFKIAKYNEKRYQESEKNDGDER